jgi:multidrug efflux pump subunit AcrA (membrane-fusion protein)
MKRRESLMPPRRPANQRPGWLGIAIRSAISLILIGLSILVFVAVGSGRSPAKQESMAKAIPVVEVLAVQAHEGGIDFDVDGVVVPFREIEVPAEVAGKLAYKSENCQPGHVVEKGELLARIDKREYALDLRSLDEEVKQAEANLAEMDVDIEAKKRQIDLALEDLEIKQREVKRYRDIEDPRVYSKTELDSARLRELQARDALQTEKDQLALFKARRNRLLSAIELGKAQRDRATLNLERTDILAPISGVITREGPEQGGYLQRGGMVAVIQDMSLMEIQCSLPMSQMSWLWQVSSKEGETPGRLSGYDLPETPCTVEFTVATKRYRWQGSLDYFDSAQVDRQTRMVPCRVTVRSPEEFEVDGEEIEGASPAAVTLMVGMFVKVRVHAKPELELLRLSSIAVQPGNHVWIVRPDTGGTKNGGRLHTIEIQVAHAEGDTVLAYASASELQVGDLVVVSPLASPAENEPVEILESR